MNAASTPSSAKEKASSSTQDNIISEAALDKNTVPLNAHGGVLVDQKELQEAFKMLDIEKSGNITTSNLKKRLGIFFPELTTKEYRFMMNNKKEMSFEDFEALLENNDITNFDPVEEAFKLYDVNGDGFIDKFRLRDIFQSYGFDDMTKDDMDILSKAADVDGDGKITLSDFRKMLESVDSVLDNHAIQKSA